MLHGHVDQITPTLISGWAIDRDYPNDPVEVCLFVGGHKIAQITCDQFRPELRGKPGFGDGKHSFRYSPTPPLPTSVPTRVTVRHAVSGRILGDGDIVLNGDGQEAPPDLGVDLPQEFLRISAPETPRQTFSSLLLYDRRQGLYNLLRQMNFAGHSADKILSATLYEVIPAEIEAPTGPQPFLLRDLLNEFLLSREFRDNVLKLLLDAFPEKHRLLFIHIPKCAGSDLSAHLVSRYPSVSERLRTPSWVDDRQLFEALSTTVRQMHFSIRWW